MHHFTRGTTEEPKGHPHVPPGRPMKQRELSLPCLQTNQPNTAGPAGSSCFWSSKEQRGSKWPDSLPPLHPCSSDGSLQTALKSLLRWFCHLSVLVTDTKSLSLPGSVAEGTIQNCIAPYIMKQTYRHSTPLPCSMLRPAWLQLGPLGMGLLMPLRCFGLLSRTPAPSDWSEQPLTLNESPTQLQSRWSEDKTALPFPLSCSHTHDF